MKSPAETLKHSVRGPFLYAASLHNFRDGIKAGPGGLKCLLDRGTQHTADTDQNLSS
ncbi:MAG: hypothetical protein NVS2B12_40650 [Ktedonobacteraceae bacterium]